MILVFNASLAVFIVKRATIWRYRKGVENAMELLTEDERDWGNRTEEEADVSICVISSFHD
ncbi:hypothetical protein TRV_02154 [Trichophyton verrucosum HKI 0517]|uniref:Uncharacterized protein n=1 Tax=Trichophyton verrucosum (strain HKI 0517) TaxID=663202 RepID=D4D4Y6_TRIVH|nr:uncharacterized protein TRV_02154 [Trichophyton verrucosum HKI 0517]EFE43084.1 hypothetical protein TRV_02154 [Trichophyton verrucosum HKI 0517]